MAPHEVVFFLELMRRAQTDGRLTYRKRDKNRATLLALGLTPSQMLEIVTTLAPDRALGPPQQNRHPDYPDESMCEFGTRIEGRDIYVKATVIGTEDGATGCVVSFHFAESALRFPFE